MQAIFDYVSPGDLWGLAIIAAMIAILAANCSYQKHRTLPRDRVPRRARANAQVTEGFPVQSVQAKFSAR